jgi:hypothetical protein
MGVGVGTVLRIAQQRSKIGCSEFSKIVRMCSLTDNALHTSSLADGERETAVPNDIYSLPLLGPKGSSEGLELRMWAFAPPNGNAKAQRKCVLSARLRKSILHNAILAQ